jgi:poly-beta-1,6-N-acetyl-D-glucosamine synthase
VFNPLWLIPAAIAALLNLRIALSMHDKSPSDLVFSSSVVGAELYLWMRMGHFVTAWGQFLARVEKDNWAAQAAAERGRGSAYVFPAIVAVVVFGVLSFAWSQQAVNVQSAILSVGWPMLYLITVLQTLFMCRKLLRRQRGFKV